MVRLGIAVNTYFLTEDYLTRFLRERFTPGYVREKSHKLQ